jgi:putative protease
VQDIGIVRLIQRVYPGLEVHGSTQMTVHDASGARVMQELGIERVVLARENTLDDVRAIREACPTSGSRRSSTARCASRTAGSATCRG